MTRRVVWHLPYPADVPMREIRAHSARKDAGAAVEELLIDDHADPRVRIVEVVRHWEPRPC